MKTANKVATIEIEVLTPVHIGTGQKMAPNTGFVHFPQEKRVAVLDEEKVLEVVGPDQIQTWVGLIHQQKDLLPWLQQRRPTIKAADVALRTLEVTASLGGTQEFRPMMHTGTAGERPYIPGSSLKGAVRTGLFADAMRGAASSRHLQRFPGLGEEKEKQILKIKQKQSAEPMTKSVFGQDPNHDYLRLLHIGDAHFAAGGTHCIKAFAYNQHGLDDNAEFREEKPHLLEVLPTGATAIATWHSADVLAKRVNAENVMSPPAVLAGFGTLMTLLNTHTRRLVEQELNSLPAGKNEGYRKALRRVLHQIKHIEQRVPGREAVLRVGFGSGHLFMTGGWFDNLAQDKREIVASVVRDKPHLDKFYDTNLPFPKSRKLVPGTEDGKVALPLGFVKLTLLTEEEIIVRAAAQQQAQAAREAEKLAADQKAALEKAEADHKARTAAYFPSRVKSGSEFEAVVTAFANGQLTLRVLVGAVAVPPQAQHEQVVLLRYPAGLPLGAIVRVSVGAEQKGKIQSVALKTIKYDPSKAGQ